jgi:DNA-binding NtrC family response regulator
MSTVGLFIVSLSQLAEHREGSEVFWGRDLLRSTPSLHPLIRTLARAAADDQMMLLTGESGTGKSHLARLLHDHSPRKDQPLVVLPCTTLSPGEFARKVGSLLPDGLPERSPSGLVAPTGRATVLVDDVDALGPEQRSQLLALFEAGIRKPAERSSTRSCPVRVLATSKLRLGDLVAGGYLPAPWHEQLRGRTLHLPPLRERREDIAPLVRRLVAQFAMELGKGKLSLDPAALKALENFSWPGNIRQLQNVVRQAVMACPGPELLKWDLPLGVRDSFIQPRDGVSLPRTAAPPAPKDPNQ